MCPKALGEPKAFAALEIGGQAWAEKETQTKVESGPWVCGLRKLGDELFTNTRPRLEICRDRRDRRSCKIFVSCVNFSRKQRDFSDNLRKTRRFTHTLSVTLHKNC